MRGKKILTALLSAALVCLLLPGNVGNAEEISEAENLQDEAAQTEAVLSYDLLVNGEDFRVSDGTFYFEKGTPVTLSVENVTLDGTSAEEVSYQWYKMGPSDDGFCEIQGEVSSEYSFEFNEVADYMCAVEANGANTSVSVSLKEDTLKVNVSSDPSGEIDEWGDYQIYDIAQGENVTLNVEAESTQSDELTYKWSRMTLWTGEMEEVIEGATESSYTMTKAAGTERYTCEVSDGNRTEWAYFVVNPASSLTTAPTVNGVSPEAFERGYMYVAKQGEEVTMKINAASSNADVTYRWEKREFTSEGTVITPMGDSDSLTVTKGKGDQGAVEEESYFCYVDDGNEHMEVMIILFGLHPYQVTKQTETVGAADVPDVSINNDVEELSNYLLREDLEALNGGSEAEIRLTAESKTDVDDAEKAEIEKLLADDSEVGMYLDLNLYKSVDGNEVQVTETGTDISLTVDVPSDMQEEGRTYQVIRIHDGSAEELDCVFDAESKTLTFDTDRFSTYAVAYKDAADEIKDPDGTENPPTITDDPENKKDPDQTTPAADKAEKTDKIDGNDTVKTAVKTGDNSSVAVWAGIALISCGVIAGGAVYRRKQR